MSCSMVSVFTYVTKVMFTCRHQMLYALRTPLLFDSALKLVGQDELA